MHIPSLRPGNALVMPQAFRIMMPSRWLFFSLSWTVRLLQFCQCQVNKSGWQLPLYASNIWHLQVSHRAVTYILWISQIITLRRDRESNKSDYAASAQLLSTVFCSVTLGSGHLGFDVWRTKLFLNFTVALYKYFILVSLVYIKYLDKDIVMDGLIHLLDKKYQGSANYK